MDDLISRQMLLEYIHGEPVGRLLCDKYNLDGLIKQFPSAQPYTDEEIQKMQDIEQAQFDKIRELAYQDGKADAMAKIIRCRDCCYWIPGLITDNDCFIPPKCGKYQRGKYQQMVGHSADDYCSYAERLEVSE